MTSAEMKEIVRKVWAALRDDQVDAAFSYMADVLRRGHRYLRVMGSRSAQKRQHL
jgi:hypothetical protein